MPALFDVGPACDALDALLGLPSPFTGSLTPLLLEPRESRSSSAQNRNAIVADLDDSLIALDAIQQRLDAVRSRYRSWRGQIANSLPAITVLPPEVLRIIFRLCHYSLDEMLFERHMSPPQHKWTILRISHVCATWRRISTHDAHLWTCVQVDSTPSVSLISVYGVHAAPHRISVVIGGRLININGTDLVYPSFQFRPSPSDMASISSLCFADSNAPFCFSLDEWKTPAPSNLEKVCFIENMVSLHPFFSNVQSLRLEEVCVGTGGTAKALPFLHTLEILRMDGHSLRPLFAMQMPALRRLTFSDTSAKSDWHDNRLFSRPVFGALECLRIDHDTYDIWSQFAHVSFPKLHEFELFVEEGSLYRYRDPSRGTHPEVLSVANLATFLRSHGAPLRVLRLSIAAWHVPAAVHMLNMRTDDGTPFCPGLRELHITFVTSQVDPTASEETNKTLRDGLEPRLHSDFTLFLSAEYAAGNEQWYQSHVAQFEVTD